VIDWVSITEIYVKAQKYGDCFAGFCIDQILIGKEKLKDPKKFRFKYLKIKYFKMWNLGKPKVIAGPILKPDSLDSSISVFEKVVIGTASKDALTSIELDFNDLVESCRKRKSREMYRRYPTNYKTWNK